jgi:hypothetical protein
MHRISILLTLFLCFSIFHFTRCSSISEEEKLLTGSSEKKWRLTQSFGILDGDTVRQETYPYYSWLDMPKEVTQFLTFKPDSIYTMEILSHMELKTELSEHYYSLDAENKTFEFLNGKESASTPEVNRLQNIVKLTKDTFIISLKQPDTKRPVSYMLYTAASKEVEVWQQPEYDTKITEKLGPKALERGFTIEKISASDFEAKRNELLSLKHWNLPSYMYRVSHAVVVEKNDNGNVTLMYVTKDGNSAIYHNQGFAFSGGNKVRRTKYLAKKLASQASRFHENMKMDLPVSPIDPGYVRFYMISQMDIGVVEKKISSIKSSHGDYILVNSLSEKLMRAYNLGAIE